MFSAVRKPAGPRLRVVAFLAGGFLVGGLAACATPNSWTKEGTSPDLISQDLSICRQNVPPSIARDNAIEADIMATRSGDLQKLDVLKTAKENDEHRDLDITQTIIDQCMVSKGYSRGDNK